MTESDSGTGTCSTCGAGGHDLSSCTVSTNPDKCSGCGYQGHDKRNCPRA